MVCLGIYWNALGNGFHYDDIHSIVDNPSVRSLENIPSFFTDLGAFSADTDRGMFRPLLLVSYAFNHALGAYDVGGYRLVNILLHAVNACLVAWLTVLLYPGRRHAALIAGLLFAAHPLATEPVNYISSRSESLAAMFYLLTLALYLRASKRTVAGNPYGAWVAFELGLLTKMTLVTAPLVLLFYDWVSKRKAARQLLRWQLPFWVLLIVHFAVVTYNDYLTRSLGAPVRDFWAQLLTQMKAVGYYLYLTVVPTHLNVEHQFFVQRQLSPLILVSLGLIASGLWLLWLIRHRSAFKIALLGMGWSALIMLPVMAMPLNVLVNERRLYLPTAIFCLLLGILLSRYCPKRRSVIPVLGILMLSVICVQRNRVWADDFSLWGDVVGKAPLMPRGHLYLGNAHKDAALKAVEGVAAKPHWRAAAAAYERVIELKSDRALSLRALNNLGSILLSHGRLQDAETVFRQATDLDPDFVDARVNLGVIHLQQSRARKGGERMLLLRRSINSLERAVSLKPYHWQAYGNLGVAYQDLGDIEKARQAYEQAIGLKSDDARTLKNLAVLHAGMAAAGRPGETDAMQHLTTAQGYLHRAIRAEPRYQPARDALSKVEAELERSGAGR
jgi:hypothetical protein